MEINEILIFISNSQCCLQNLTKKAMKTICVNDTLVLQAIFQNFQPRNKILTKYGRRLSCKHNSVIITKCITRDVCVCITLIGEINHNIINKFTVCNKSYLIVQTIGFIIRWVLSHTTSCIVISVSTIPIKYYLHNWTVKVVAHTLGGMSVQYPGEYFTHKRVPLTEGKRKSKAEVEKIFCAQNKTGY
jgi:hypothetical protein